MAITEGVTLEFDATAPDVPIASPLSSHVSTTSLANRGFVAIGDNAGSIDGNIYNAAGVQTGSISDITGTDGAVAQLSNGQLAIVSQDSDSVLVTLVNASTGAAIGGPRDVLAPLISGTGISSNADVAALAGPNAGSFVVAYQVDFGGGDIDVQIEVWGNNGVGQNVFSVDISTVLADSNVSVAGLSNGTIAVAWTRSTIGSSATDIYYAIYRTDGTVVKEATKMPTRTSVDNQRHNPSIVATPDGFAIAFESTFLLRRDEDAPQGAPFDHDIYISRVDLNGNATFPTEITNTGFETSNINEGGTNIDPSIALSPDGNLLVSYTNVNFDVEPDASPITTHVAVVRGTDRIVTTGSSDGGNSAIISFGVGQIGVFQANDGAITGTHLTGFRDIVGDQAEPLNETIRGDDFRDLMNGLGGDDNLDGGGNNDELLGSFGNDILHGGQGNDKLAGNGEGDNGSEDEADRLFGDDGNDQIFGEGGDDFLIGGRGNDLIDGGDGIDTVSYVDAVGSGVTVSLAVAGPQSVGGGRGTDTIAGVENITGSQFSDRLVGTGGANVIDGGVGGDDIVSGGGGDDNFRFAVSTLSGGDQVNGGSGVDVLSFKNAGDISASAFANVTRVEKIVLANGVNAIALADAMVGAADGKQVSVIGTAGNETFDARLVTTAGNRVVLAGGGGNDVYFVVKVADQVLEAAGGGNDQIFVIGDYALAAGQEIERLTATFTNTTNAMNLTGNSFGNRIEANGGVNVIDGGGGNDVLLGLGGRDTLIGGSGADRLTGGAGRDIMTGGADADIFLFGDGDFEGATMTLADAITDFSHAQGDRIDLSLIDANGNGSGNPAFAFIGTAAFSGVAGQLRFEQISGNTFVFGDVNGDKSADIAIRLSGLHALVGGDFVL
jgi:hypothetical protein